MSHPWVTAGEVPSNPLTEARNKMQVSTGHRTSAASSQCLHRLNHSDASIRRHQEFMLVVADGSLRAFVAFVNGWEALSTLQAGLACGSPGSPRPHDEDAHVMQSKLPPVLQQCTATALAVCCGATVMRWPACSKPLRNAVAAGSSGHASKAFASCVPVKMCWNCY
jgi:hypothetical protein